MKNFGGEFYGTYFHTFSLSITLVIVIGCGIYSAQTVKSAEGFSLGGRSSGVKLIAGSIAGTAIGGSATIGTAQTAYIVGLSAWWFTIGVGIGLLLLGLFYARPLRNTRLETIPQYLVLNYGKAAGPLVSIISSLGILFSAVASSLPGIQIIAAIFGLAAWKAAVILVILVVAYVFFGGMKGAGVSGLLKLVIIWITLFTAGWTAFISLRQIPDLGNIFPAYPWFSFFGNGVENDLGNLFSVIVGMICTQTYIQAIYSASDSRTAAVGAFTAALVIIPVGIPTVAIGMFMHAAHPDILPIMVLPTYLLQYQPAWLGGIGLAGILLSLIGSIAGLALGIGTMVSKDFCYEWFHFTASKTVLWTNRITVLFITCIAALIAVLNPGSFVLDWNYMSMAFRGAGVFLPLTLAIFVPGRLLPGWAVLSMILSTVAALAAKTFLHLAMNPLFIGIAVSAMLIVAGLLVSKGKITDSHLVVKRFS